MNSYISLEKGKNCDIFAIVIYLQQYDWSPQIVIDSWQDDAEHVSDFAQISGGSRHGLGWA